jgi:hypothetical protein
VYVGSVVAVGVGATTDTACTQHQINKPNIQYMRLIKPNTLNHLLVITNTRMAAAQVPTANP